MAREYFVVCDGCDKRLKVDSPDGMGSGAAFLSCAVSINGTADKKFEVCQSCFDRLIEAADPKKWARCAAESMMDRPRPKTAA